MRTSQKRRGNRSIYIASFEACERRLLMSTYTVNTISDAANPGAGLLTFRQAISDANTSPANDIINFSPTVFKTGSVHTITLTQGQLSMIGTTTIDGPSAGNVTIDANHASRAFEISQGSLVTLENLTITNGLIAPVPGQPAHGGAISNAGHLELDNAQIINSMARGGSYTGGGPTFTSGIGGAGAGGAIYSSGELVIVGSKITGNTVQGGSSYEYYSNNVPTNIAQGGAIYSSGPLSISGSTINQNSATGGGDLTGSSADGASFGGAVYDSGTLYLAGSTLADNTSYGGSGDDGFGAMDSAANGYGGALYITGNSVLSNTTFNANTVHGGNSGGGGGTAGIASGGAFYTTGPTSGDHLTIENNTAIGGGGPYNDNGPGGDAYGAGITSTASLNISSSVITSNTATGGFGEPDADVSPKSNAFGGGIYTTGSLTVVTSTISGNIAQADPNESGGQYAYGGTGGQAQGGGIFTSYSANISSSTISGNSALGGVGDPPYLEGTAGNGGDGLGGGIYNGGTLVITNSTLTINNAAGGEGADGGELGGSGGDGGNGIGGAIVSSNSLSLYDTTISGNTATGGAGGPVEDSNGTAYFNGDPGKAVGAGVSISAGFALADNTVLSGNLDAGSTEDDIAGQLDGRSSYNLIGTGGYLTNGNSGNLVGINNPQLAPLGSYGGLTQTLPPTAASPALNAGSNSYVPSGITTDQRGDARITAGTVDIGSVELQTGNVSGTLFNDLNGDGIRQSGEPVLAGVTVYADLSNAGTYKTGDPVTVTNSSGNYTLNGLPEGALIIRQQPPSGYRQTYPAATAGEHVTVTPAGVTGALFADSTKLYVAGTVKLNGVGQSGVVVYADLNNDGKFESSENNKTTASDGTYAFVGLAAGTYTFRVLPPAGDVATGNVATTVTLGSGGVDGGVNFTLAKSVQSQLTGTIIGTIGSYQNDGNTIAKAFDGNLSTFFDGPTANGNYAGLDLITPQIISSISFAPRSSYPNRMVGGIFQASNSASFTNSVNLYTITKAPAVGVLTNIPITNTTAFRYVRYLSPNGSFGNVAELQFFTPALTPVTLSNGILTVNGTTAADTINVNYGIENEYFSQNVITVTINGVTQVLDGQVLHQVIINAGEGNNVINITGTEDNDFSATPDIATTVNAGSGNDTITLSTQAEDENYTGSSITINTGNGNNSVNLTYNGYATINGGSGDDTMLASLGYDELGAYATMNGGDGDDTFTTGSGGYAYATAYGKGGNDTFNNGDPDDRMYADGGTGSNTFELTGGPAANFYGGPIDLSAGTFSSGTLTNIQNVTGYSDGALTVIGNDQSNLFKIASEGGEPLSLYGGGGNDTFYERDNQYTYIDGGTGNDTAYTDPTDTVVNVENLNPDLPTLTTFTGTPIGTAGSYQNQGNTIAKVFDGNLSTYFDAPTSTGNYVGLDLGSAKVVDTVRFAPRSGWESRMLGGQIQASNSADFSNAVTLDTIDFTPVAGTLTQIGFTNTTAYRYYRYLGPTGSFCNIAELNFEG